ncbi:methanol/ethanol family PQQ-dependent dehydrogenase [uncultured Azohydromonas sp.]|jgi:PQQ-dependent dehydrogenase, methanol/ethanol family|uniref:methanol/ethanol family PQQ-dependent dehydrogenase n=1 Tax=uncultured Azohydromonas sp. TaxID=487342 RepID=UPI00262A239C|nr:methanol/ethanol family PQQ-dependent dehydrogenase [uncultured Azohydromonas sp.]
MRRAAALLCLALMTPLAWAQAPAAVPSPSASTPAAPPEHDPAGDWPMAARDHANTRFSPLAQITPDNVARLRPVLERATGAERGHEAAPIVAGGTMFVVTPYPNELLALDLARPGFPLKWRYRPHPDAAAQGVACCDVVNRGAAYDGGRVFFNTLDGLAIAVDAATGRELWRTKLGDLRRGETITMAPLVVRGKVLIGNSGGEYGMRGWLVALDAASGKERWRAWSTGPDKDVLIGTAFKPFYPQDRGPDLGERSWPGQAWKQGGGNVWGWVSYDPRLDLLYHGTGNPGPWNPEQRPGSNHWTSGVFARRPDSGEAVWFYQWSPHDLHDYDGVNENVLLDLPIGGRTRQVLVHPDRNGYLYVLDRATGQVLSADPFAAVTTSLGVDLQSGALRYEPSKAPRAGKPVRDICPASPGAKDWQPSAWSPRTRLLYIPHQNLCQDATTSTVSYIAGTPYLGADVKMKPGPGGHRGALDAWDPVARKAVWTIKEHFPVWSGALATAGGLVFYGTMDGWFKAVDARSGKALWKHRTPSGIVGQPVSFLGPDGRQYIAVLSGVGGWAGAIVAGGLDPRDGTAALGFLNAMRDLPQATRKGGAIHVFALPK